MKKEYRIYGKENDSKWKLLWATQNEKKEIQIGTQITGGTSYTSIHADGKIHSTSRDINGKHLYGAEVKRPWTINDFKLLEPLYGGGLAKEALRTIPTSKMDSKKETDFLDLCNFENEINYWLFLSEKKYAEQIMQQLVIQFPKIITISPKTFDPTLILAFFDPIKSAYGTQINVEAEENSMKMTFMPKLTFQLKIDSLATKELQEKQKF